MIPFSIFQFTELTNMTRFLLDFRSPHVYFYSFHTSMLMHRSRYLLLIASLTIIPRNIIEKYFQRRNFSQLYQVDRFLPTDNGIRVGPLKTNLFLRPVDRCECVSVNSKSNVWEYLDGNTIFIYGEYFGKQRVWTRKNTNNFPW